jgi:hypothetical protein
MSELLKAGAGAVFLIGAGIFASMSSADTQKRAVAHYGLNEVQVDYQKACQSSLSKYDKEFKGGASRQVGCACVAAEIGKVLTVTSAADYEKYKKVQSVIVKHAPTDDSDDMDVMGVMTDLSTLEGVAVTESYEIMGHVGEAIGACKSARLPAKVPENVSVSGQNSSPSQGCNGLSERTMNQLKKVAERNGEKLEDVCARVSTSS